MKCIGRKCSGYSEKYLYPTCSEITTPEVTYRIGINTECKLPEKIREVRDDLLRRSELLEEILMTK